MTARSPRPRLVVAGAAVCALIITLVGTGQPAVAVLAKSSPHTSHVSQCIPSELSATLALSPVGGSSTSLAGAVIFSNNSNKSCALEGVPKVGVIAAGGQAIPVYQASVKMRKSQLVTLSMAHSSAGMPDAGTSITWSSWNCGKGSFALDIQFSGWSEPITAPYGTTAGYSGTPCASTQATLYVGPAARAAAPAGT
jgi:hypothetical protein